MKNFYSNLFFKSISLGLGVLFSFGIFILVRAVAPGVVTNPTFTPSVDDVQMNFIKGPTIIVENTVSAGDVSAVCPAGYKVSGGGCSSAGGLNNYRYNNPKSDLSGWDCIGWYTTSMTAQAVCVKSR